jgi:pimeloyl-ACP methyl ester carboxylesterase
MAEMIGANATLVEVPEAGHAVHLERAAEVAAAIRRFEGCHVHHSHH